MSVRVRFAPSPTGSLHIGNARAALFNWLYARKHRGSFILRIEDTDRERSRPEWEGAILEDLRWLGLDWDEGPDMGGTAGPYRQSESDALYQEAAAQLLSRGRAYRCFCSTAELEAERKRLQESGQPPRYSGRCRELPAIYAEQRHEAGDPSAVRFKMPSEEIIVSDLVRGEVKFHGRDLDDFILLRADRSASFHLAVVVDDHRMGITHVIRGEDHLTNAARHVVLGRALRYSLPHFAHLPLILGWDRTPLSKRHGDYSVAALRRMGFLPEAVVNYLMLLSWSPPEGTPELMTIREMVERFTLERVSHSPAQFDQARLLWFNRQYIHRVPVERLVSLLHSGQADELTHRAINALRLDADSVAGLENLMAAIRQEPKPRTLQLTAADRRALEALDRALGSVAVESVEDARVLLERVAQELSAPKRNLMHAARLALIGSPQGPPVAALLWILGPERARRRLARALAAPVAS